MLAALLLFPVPVPAFGADSSFMVGTDSNKPIVAPLKGAVSGDTVTLTGSGTVSRSNAEVINAAIVLFLRCVTKVLPPA